MKESWVRSLGWKESPGVSNGKPYQYSCLENSIDREAWQDTVHGVTESQTQLNMNTHVDRSHFMNYEDSVFAHIPYTLSYKLDYSVRFNIIS